MKTEKDQSVQGRVNTEGGVHTCNVSPEGPEGHRGLLINSHAKIVGSSLYTMFSKCVDSCQHRLFPWIWRE